MESMNLKHLLGSSTDPSISFTMSSWRTPEHAKSGEGWGETKPPGGWHNKNRGWYKQKEWWGWETAPEGQHSWEESRDVAASEDCAESVQSSVFSTTAPQASVAVAAAIPSGGNPQSLGSGEGQLGESPSSAPHHPHQSKFPPSPPPPPPPLPPESPPVVPCCGGGQLRESPQNLSESPQNLSEKKSSVAVAASASGRVTLGISAVDVGSGMSSGEKHAIEYFEDMPQEDPASAGVQQAGNHDSVSETGNSQAARDASASIDSPATLALVAVAASSGKPAEARNADFFKGAKLNVHHRQHNGALKFLREVADPVLGMILSDNMEVFEILHEHKGTYFEIDYSRKVHWSWLDLVKQLVDDDIEFVVNGENGTGGGLTHCTFSARPGSYDHARHHIMWKEGVGSGSQSRLAEWDFVLHRADGTSIRLHPTWSKTKFPSCAGAGHPNPVSPPKAGLGASDGRGTFKKYKELGNERTLRFDPKKFDSSLARASQ